MILRIIAIWFFLLLSIVCLGGFFYGVFALKGDLHQLVMDGCGLGAPAFSWCAKKLVPKDQ